MKDFIRAYIECALWCGVIDPAGEMVTGTSQYQLLSRARKALTRDALAFWKENEELIGRNTTQAGHDFWLTRNRHGAGFWETDTWSKEEGEALTKAAHAYGEQSLYTTDRGKIDIF